jgi:serine/threonine protein kinase
MTAVRPDSRLGTDLGPYRIERVLGRGGMGVVYLAEQRELGRKVALKLLPDELAQDADFRARFERESRLAAAIDHPNIIPLYEAGEIEGTAFLAMRFVDGVDLASRLAGGPLDPTEAVVILAQVAGALDAAHARGLVHRDVKPGNVLVDQTAQGEHAYLTDFGLTKQTGTESGLTRMGSFMGTPAYMAPEQIEGQDVDGRADQYSLACMAFELLTGQVPFQRDQEFAVAMAHVRDRPPTATSLRPELPGAVDAVFAQAMAKDREARYPTCSAFVDDLRTALGGGQITARPFRAQSRRGPVLVAGAVGFGLVAVAGMALASGMLGGPGSLAPSGSGPLAITSASPEPTTSPTPDPSVFPNADEAALLALLPPDLRPTCVRGATQSDATKAGFEGQVVGSFSGTGGSNRQVNKYSITVPKPKAGVVCAPKDGPSVSFQFHALAGGRDATSIADQALSDISARYVIPDGDCGNGAPAKGTWSSASSGFGHVACIHVSTFDGKPWIYWSFGGGRVLAFATRKDADYDALYRWWQNLTLFIE